MNKHAASSGEQRDQRVQRLMQQLADIQAELAELTGGQWTEDMSHREVELAEANRALQETADAMAQARDQLRLDADQLESRVKQRTAELEAIIASLPDAVYVGNENGILRCNQRALDNLGCESIEELQAKIPILSEKLQNRYAVTGERIKPQDEAFARALRGQPWTYEVISCNLKTGQDIVQRCAANPILLDGRVIGAVAINTDITEQKRLEQALRQAHDELELRVQERTAQVEAEMARRQDVTQQLRALSRRLVQVQEDERRSLALATHDSSGQALTALKLGMTMLQREGECSESMLSRIEDLRGIADTVAEDLHRLSVNLRPPSLDRYGLVPALEQLIASFRNQASIEVDFLVQGMEGRLPSDMETALYRIVQEATTNIARYSEATLASVLVQRKEDALQVIVEDNGRGFDVEEALHRGRLGLLGMRERAEMLGGTLSIESSPGNSQEASGSGTTLYVQVPLSETDSEGTSEAGEETPGRAPTGIGHSLMQANAEIASEAAELARAKALSDVLVEIMAGVARLDTAKDSLAFVLARSAEAIGCDYALIGLREGDHWVVSDGYQLPDSIIGQRFTDETLPVAVQVEQTGEIAVVNGARSNVPLAEPFGVFGVFSGAAIPLVAGGKSLGVVAYAHNSALAAFKPSEKEFLERLAALVSLAIENIKLHETEAQQRSVLQTQADELAQVNARLADERDRLRVLLTSIPDEVWFCDAQGNFTAANPAAVHGLGFDKPGETFQPIPEWPKLEVRTPEGRPRPLEDAPLLRALRGERVERQEEIARNLRTGEWRYRQASAQTLRDAAGQVLGAVLLVQDVTEQKRADQERQRAQAALAASEERYRLLFDSMSEGFVLTKVLHDQDGQPLDYLFLDMNPAGLRSAGLQREDLVGKTARQVNPNLEAYWVETFGRVARTGQPECFENYVAYEDRWYELNVYRFGTDLVAALSQDVTERRRNDATYRSIARGFPNGAIYVFGRDLRYQVVEGELLPALGQSPAGLEGKTIWELFDEKTLRTIEPRYRRALAGESLHFETFYGEPSGNRTISADYRPIRAPRPSGDEGPVVAGLLVVQDVSARVKMEEAIRQTSTKIEQERDLLRTILTSITDEVWFSDAEQNFYLANPAAVRGLGFYKPEETFVPVPEWYDLKIYNPDGGLRPHEDAPLLRALRGETIPLGEEIARRLDTGELRHRQYGAAPIRDSEGRIIGSVAAVRDVTPLKEAAQERERLLVELQEKVAEQEAILKAIADGLVVYDTAGRIVRMNGVAEEMLGYGREVQDTTLEERMASVIDARMADGSPFTLDNYPATRALHGEVVRNQEMTFRLPHRGDLRVSVSSAPIRAQDGTITGCVTTLANTEAYHQAIDQLSQAHRDVSQREAALHDAMSQREAALQSLRQANARLSQRELVLQHTVAELGGILTSLPSGLIVYDREGHIVRMNSLAQGMLSYDEETWKRPVGERVTSVVQLSRPDGSAYAWEEYPAIRALRGETVQNEDVFLHLTRHPEKDFWAMMSASPFRGQDGELLGAVMTMTDVSDLNQVRARLQETNEVLRTQANELSEAAERLEQRVQERTAALAAERERLATALAALAESEARYRAIGDLIPYGMWICHPDGSSAYLSASFLDMLGMTFEEFRERGWLDRLPPEGVAPMLAKWERCLKTGETWDHVHHIRGSDGIYRDILSRGVPMRDVRGGITAWVGLNLDITERVTMEAQREEALQAFRISKHQLQALSRRLVQMQESERSHVADQLFNQASQVLAALKMQLHLMETEQPGQASAWQLAEMRATLDEAIHELHDLATELRPIGLDRAGILGVLRRYLTDFGAAHGLSAHFNAEEVEDLRLPSDAATAVYRAVEEALANIARHAQASEVTLLIGRLDNSLTISIEDNGLGFDPETVPRDGGVGLIGMRERIEAVGGRLALESGAGGTNLFIEVPLAN